MNSTPPHGDIEKHDVDTIIIPDFDISWAGEVREQAGWPAGFCFGSEDGRILRSRGFDEIREVGRDDVAPSKEAVNGIVFAGDIAAVSTRSEVVFLDIPSGEGKPRQAVFHSGAHGVVATSRGRIIAPLGIKGLLLTGPEADRIEGLRVKIQKPEDPSLNFYKIVSLNDTAQGEVLACAARQGGLAVMMVTADGLVDSGRSINSPGIDIVDVCALGSGNDPLAAAALGRDGSIYLTRDVLRARSFKVKRIAGIRGRGYRIFGSKGTIFVLTSRGLYALIGLASRFIEGVDDESKTMCRWSPYDAVDASLVHDRWLMVVMPECVHRLEIDSLIAGNGRSGDPYAGTVDNQAATMLPTDRAEEAWNSVGNITWAQPLEFTFPAVEIQTSRSSVTPAS